MRVEPLEKLVRVLTGLSALATGGLVTALSVLPPLRSGIPDVAVNSAIRVEDWLNAARQRTGRSARILEGQPMLSVPSAPAPPSAPGAPEAAAPTPAAAAATRSYFDTSGNIPVAEQVPGFEWLRRQPGVSYMAPKAVPDILYRKYQSFEETWNLVQEGGGEFVQTAAGTAYQVNWVAQESMLATRLGLKQGDKVISVNGQPVGTSLGAGQAMFEQFKNETRFAVMVERDGKPVVLSFYVN